MALLKVELLEERIVLDGAIAADIATPPTQTPDTADTHVLVISDAVADADAVAESAGDGVVVVQYDANSNDLSALSQQISNALGGQKADSIAFVTEGFPGKINIFNNMAVNEVSINTQQMVDFWSDVGSYVFPNGSVDILSCNVAATSEGVQLLESIKVLLNDSGSNINVSASTDLTGHDSLGGDWVLEYSTSIDFTDHDVKDTYFDTNEIDNWEYVLAPDEPDLEITKTVSDINGGTVDPGDMLEYTVTLFNNGTANAENIVITNAIPGDTTYVASSLFIGGFSMTDTSGDDQAEIESGSITYRVGLGADNTTNGGILAPGETVSVTFRVTIETANTTINDTSSVSYKGPDPDGLLYNDSSNILISSTGPTISIADANVAEGGSLSFAVALNYQSATPITVYYSTADGTATIADNDYNQVSNQILNFAPGETSKLATVTTNGDLNFEGDEALFVNLINATNATIFDNEAIGAILDNDVAPQLQITKTVNDTTAAPGGVLEYSITVTNTGSVNADNVTITDVIPDYTAYIGSSIFIGGISMSDTIGDDQAELDVGSIIYRVGVGANASNGGTLAPGESVVVTFSAFITTANTTIGNVADVFYQVPGVGGLEFNESSNLVTTQSTSPTISIASASVTEGGSLSFAVALNYQSATPITVYYSTADGTATIADNDYNQVSNQILNFAPGETSKLATVTTNGDSNFEVDETLFVNLSNATNATIFDNQGTGLILDNDVAPQLEITKTVNDTNAAPGGVLEYSITVTNTGSVDADNVTITDVIPNYTTYVGSSIFIGGISMSDTIGDDQAELDVGSIIYRVGAGANASNGGTLAPGESVVVTFSVVITTANTTINNVADVFYQVPGVGGLEFNESSNLVTTQSTSPTISIANASVTEGGSLSFAVALNYQSATPISVYYSTADGTATIADNDYSQVSNQILNFAPGETLKFATVATNGDANFEMDETLFVNLSSATNATIFDSQGTGLILDNDVAPQLEITKTVTDINGGTVDPGDVLEYSITVTNTGSVDANNVTITDVIPNYTAYVGSSIFIGGILMSDTIGDDQAELDVGSIIYRVGAGANASNGGILAPGESVVVTFSVIITTANTTINNVADVFFQVPGVGGLEFNESSNLVTTQSTGPTISIANASVTEGGSLNFSVTLSHPSATPITVYYSTADGTATQPNDYIQVSNQILNFAAGDTQKFAVVSTNQDVDYEAHETLLVNLSNATDATISPTQGSGTGTIQDNDTAPTISIVDTNGIGIGVAQFLEGSLSNNNKITFTVSLDKPSYEDIVFTYSTSDGTATLADNDYTQVVAQTFTILAGNTSGTFTVDVTADGIFEHDETININLDVTSGTVVGDTSFSFQGLIVNDDNAPTLSIDNVTVNESNSSALFTVTRTGETSFPVYFAVNTADNTATFLTDYTQIINIGYTILPGGATNSVTVVVGLAYDNVYELTESFFVNLTPDQPELLSDTGNDLQGIGTIIDNDPAPTITIDNVTVSENAGTATFTVTRTGATALDVGFTVNTANGTAFQPNDYTQILGAAYTIAAGGASKTISFDVSITDDNVYELTENFFVNLTIDAPANVNLGASDLQGIGTITNDDAAPTITINDVTVSENAGTATFTVTRTGETALDVGFTVNTANGTAIQPNDYTQILGGAYTILAGGATKTATFVVAITNDNTYELTENFFANLTIDVPANVNLGASDLQGKGTITNDDAAPTISIIRISSIEGEGIIGFPLGGNIATLPGNFVFQVVLSNPTYEDLIISVVTVDGTVINFAATAADNDYIPINTPLSIAAGQTVSAIQTVNFIADNKFEYDETFSVQIGAVTGSGGGQFTAGGVDSMDVLITNDDGAPVITINDTTVPENIGSGITTFTVTRTGVTAFDVGFTVNTANGTATQPSDYTQIVGGSHIILAGGATNTTTFDVSIINDGTFELTETFFANLTVDVPMNVTSSGNDLQGIATIIDDDPQPIISIIANTPTTINEGIEGVPSIIGVSNPTPNGTVNITITLTNPTFEDVFVTINTKDGVNSIDFNTGTAPAQAIDGQGDADYIPISQTFTIAAGSTSATFTVNSVADEKFEFNETFSVDITKVTGSVGGSMYVNTDTNNKVIPIIIVNDDNKPVIRLIANPTVEGTAPRGPYGVGGPPTTSMVFGIIRYGATAFDIFVQPTTPGSVTDTAFSTLDLVNNDNDYFTLVDAGTLISASNSTTETVTTYTTIEIIQDNKFELNETFTVKNLVGSQSLVDEANSDITFEATILNDDAQPTISINDPSVVDGDSGTKPLVFDIILSNPSYEAVLVNVNTADGNSTNPDKNAKVSDNDYIPLASTVTFTEGVITDPTNPIIFDIIKQEAVQEIGDNKYELNEILLVNLGVSGGSINVTGSDLQGIGTIINNDSAPGISITPVLAKILEGNTGTTMATFVIELTNPTYQNLFIAYQSMNGGVAGVVSATGGSDYISTSGSVVIYENGLRQTVTALIKGDFSLEPNEAFSIDLPSVFINGSSLSADTTGITLNQGVIILNDDFSNFVIPALEPIEEIDKKFLVPQPSLIDAFYFGGDLDNSSSYFSGFESLGWSIDILEESRDQQPEIITSSFFDESSDEGLKGYFTIYITEQPEKPLVIELEAKGLAEGTVNPKIVVFTPDNWATPQVIRVVDPDWDPADNMEIITTVIESDDIYKEVDVPDVNIRPSSEGDDEDIDASEDAEINLSK